MRVAPYDKPNSSTAKANAMPLANIDELANFVHEHPRVFVITGAGISHTSGIPTYRDKIGNWKSSTPIQHAEFLQDLGVRKRYWARSFAGWPHVARAKPNRGHSALVELETLGYVTSLVTQNVDRLHQKAGQQRVTDLHGRLDEVLCMDCGRLAAREEIQRWLERHNPHMDDLRVEMAPDGDAHVREELIAEVRVPSCQSCDGLLKPNVVFYGGSVGREKVDYLYHKLQSNDAVLVVGSSLMVYSSFRFCKFAAEHNIPIACVNQGVTRADDLLSLKVDADCGAVLSELASNLPAL